MLPVWIGIAVIYLAIGFVISRKCLHKTGVGGTIAATIMWPLLLVVSLFTGRCAKKDSPSEVPGPQGNQGAQGPQGPTGGVA